MRKLLLSLVVLAVLVVGADRLADGVAQRLVASRLSATQGLDADPDVDITGFPFLTQLARRHYDRVVIDAPQVTVDGVDPTVRLDDVRVVFTDVRTSADLDRFTAARGRATATWSYAEISRRLGITVGYAGSGRIEATREFTVAGRSLSPTITIEPQLLDGAVDFTNTTLDDGVPGSVAGTLREVFDVSVPLDGLPFGIRARSLEAGPDGVRLQLRGRDFSYGA